MIKEYFNPMEKQFPKQYKMLSNGIKAIEIYTDVSHELIFGSPNSTQPPLLANKEFESYQKVDVLRYLAFFIKYIDT